MSAARTGESGQEMATRFAQASEALIAAVDGCTDEQWQAICPGEEQSVGTVARHVATSEPIVLGWMQTIIAGLPMPEITRELIDQSNARSFQKHAHPDRAEVLELLRRNGATVRAALANMSAEELDRSAPFAYAEGRQVSARYLADANLIDHARSHLAGIRKAWGEV
jgi:hypothetical protein